MSMWVIYGQIPYTQKYCNSRSKYRHDIWQGTKLDKRNMLASRKNKSDVKIFSHFAFHFFLQDMEGNSGVIPVCLKVPYL